MFNKIFIKVVVGKDYQFWESISAMADIELDPTIMYVFMSFLFINKLLSNVANIDADIIQAVEWILGVEVTYFNDNVLVTLAREDTVDEDFEDIKKCSFGSHISLIFDSFAKIVM